MRLKLSQLRLMLILYTPWKHQKTADFLRNIDSKGSIDSEWVKQLQYRRGRHNLMLVA